MSPALPTCPQLCWATQAPTTTARHKTTSRSPSQTLKPPWIALATMKIPKAAGPSCGPSRQKISVKTRPAVPRPSPCSTPWLPAGTVTADTIACAAFDSTVEYGSASGTDNCDSDVAYTWVEDGVVSTTCQGSYEVQRTYTFVDDCGNASTAVQLLTIVDETAPEVTGEMNISIACDAYGTDDDSDPNNILISATDDCGDVTITFEDMPFSGGCVQPFSTLMREYTVPRTTARTPARSLSSSSCWTLWPPA